MAEVELGKLAQQRGSDDRIKNFEKKLVDDHTRLNNELKDIAVKLGLTPADIGPEQRKTIDKLSTYSGSKFDSEFWKVAVQEHREALKEFRKEANNSDNQALKDFASRSIPILEQHLRMAENKGA